MAHQDYAEWAISFSKGKIERFARWPCKIITLESSEATCNIYNAIGASSENIGGSDEVSVIPGVELGIASTDPAEVTHVSLVFDDLTTAFYALGGITDIEDFQREAIDQAHDCIERVQAHADAARNHALVASCAAQSCCDGIFNNIIEDLTLALDGEDANEDGAIDLESEGTVECGIEFVSRLIGFPIAIGFSQ